VPTLSDSPRSVQTPAPAGGPVLLWQGDEYRVIEAREFHAPMCAEVGFCGHTRPIGPHVVLVECLLRTDAFGVPQWAECDGLPPEAIRAMLRALALGGAR
jgi:hypothetical protein